MPLHISPLMTLEECAGRADSVYVQQEGLMKKISLGLLLVAGLMGSAAGAEPLREIRLGGGGASCKQYFVPVLDNFENETGIHVTLAATTPVQGLIELNSGLMDIIASSIPFSSMVKGAAKNGIIIDPGLFTVRKIGSYNILVFVHNSNQVSVLNKKQLQDIFAGKIKNWKKVGGADRDIVVVWGVSTLGQNELFTSQVLEGKAVTGAAVDAFDYAEIREIISRTPGAIGIDPLGFASSNTRNPKAPRATADVIAVTKGQPKPELEQLLRYVRDYNW